MAAIQFSKPMPPHSQDNARKAIMLKQEMEQARAWIAEASRVAVLTGAGISAESGIPTFRGAGGLWRNFRAEELATPQAFARDPLMVWEWYDWRRAIIATAEPNDGHRALAEFEARSKQFTLITQNVDGLHDRAGSRNILKIHGDVWTLRCTVCAREWPDARTALKPLPPLCACGGAARPGVVWFGESLPGEIWDRAVEATRQADVFLVVGTSAVVYPAAGLIQLAHSARVIEVNPAETPVSGVVDVSLRGTAAEVLPAMLRR
jgi:NAD-dependent deacetylase